MTPIMVALFYSSAFGLAGASRPVHCVVHGFQCARIIAIYKSSIISQFFQYPTDIFPFFRLFKKRIREKE